MTYTPQPWPLFCATVPHVWTRIRAAGLDGDPDALPPGPELAAWTSRADETLRELERCRPEPQAVIGWTLGDGEADGLVPVTGTGRPLPPEHVWSVAWTPDEAVDRARQRLNEDTTALHVQVIRQRERQEHTDPADTHDQEDAP